MADRKGCTAAMVKWMVDIMLTLRLSARPSTSVLLMVQEDSPSTASSVPMELCSSSNILSVIGGSTWTVPLPRTSTHSMMNMQQKEKQTLLLELEVLNIVVAREEELEEELEAVEEVPMDHKDQLLLQEVHMLLLQEGREGLELTLDMELQEALGELLGDMKGMQERLSWKIIFSNLILRTKLWTVIDTMQRTSSPDYSLPLF